MSTHASNEYPGGPPRARSVAASADAKRTQRLSHLQDELTALITEAGAVRSRLPGQLEPDVVRLQKQMDLLSERLSALQAEATGTPRAPFENPWDAQSADALMRVYEAEEPGLIEGGTETQANIRPSVRAAATAQPAQAPQQRPQAPQRSQPMRAKADSPPLEDRFSEVARRIEDSLANMKPESSLEGLERRFEQLEERLGVALKSLATRADVHELRNVEVQIADIGAKLAELRNQLSKLDTIDAHIGALSKQLSDERLTDLFGQSQVKPADLQNMATAAVEGAMSKAADQFGGEAHTREVGEVRLLVERHINERRTHDANTVGMLETMQQTIDRVMDRIDTLEPSAVSDVVAGTEASLAEPSSAPRDETDQIPLTVDAVARHLAEVDKFDEDRDPAYEAPQFLPAGAQGAADLALSENVNFETEVIFGGETEAGTEAHDGPDYTSLPGSLEALRRDLIENAQQARMNASGDAGPKGSPAEQSTKVEHKNVPPGRRAGRLSARISQSKRRLLFLSALILLLLPAVVLLTLKLPSNWEVAGASYARFTSLLETLMSVGSGNADGSPLQQFNGNNPGSAPNQAPIRKRPDAPLNSRTAQALGDGSSSVVLPGMVISDGSPVSVAVEPISASSADAMPVVLTPSYSRNDGADPVANNAKFALPPAEVGSRRLRVAAAKGDASAQFEVAARLARGHGNLHDIEAAARWFERSAANGFAMAQYRLGTLYQKGLGAKRDLDRAKVWYRRAAEQGNAKAMHNLAVLLAGGDGQRPDYVTAAHWFTQAAERGLPDSQYNLAILYETGFGVTKNVRQAYKWLVLAAKAGDAQAVRRRDALTLALNAKDRATAEQLVRAWKATPLDPLANDARVAGRAWQGNARGTAKG